MGQGLLNLFRARKPLRLSQVLLEFGEESPREFLPGRAERPIGI